MGRIKCIRAFNQWLWQLEQAQARQELMFKAMFRWAHKDLSIALDAWRVNTAAWSGQDEALLIAEQHYRFSSLCTALQYMRDSLAASQEEANRKHLESIRTIAEKSPEPTPTPTPKRSPVVKAQEVGLASKIARAVDPYGLFSVIINRTHVGKADKSVYFVADVTLEGRTKYSLNKRYRDFEILNNVLLERFETILRGSNSPTLPPKKAFSKINAEFYETRALELHTYVQELMAHPQIAGSEELCEFLQFHSNL